MPSTEPLVIANARVWTADPNRPRADWVAIERGRIVAVGRGDPPAGPVLDARGGAAIPGLIDAHMHLLMGGQSLSELDLSGVTGRRGFEHAVAQHHAPLPAGRWLIGQGWSEEAWPGRELPNKAWLAAAGDRPVVCHRMDRHAVVVNDAVLGRCDLDDCPPGGEIHRDPRTGEPTGLLVEAAAWKLINPLIPKAEPQQQQAALLAAQDHCLARGLTSVGSMEYQRDVEQVFAPLRSRLTLRVRLTLLDRTWPLKIEFGQRFPADERLGVIGYKTFIDGTLGSRTARLLAPYADAPQRRGLLLELAQSGHLEAWARHVSEGGMSPSMHAIGDAAVRLALSAVAATDPARRSRIEHAQQIDPADIPRFAGVIASMQPLHKAVDGRYLERRVGANRLAGAFAFRKLLGAGARLAFGSDWPIVSCDPMLGIRAAVTGLTSQGVCCLPEENLTVEEALHGYTTGAAFALQMDEAGMIRPGALGDLIIVDRDPFTADWADRPPRVAVTVVGGDVVYDGSDQCNVTS